jgi:hypothetical protein
VNYYGVLQDCVWKD